MKVQEGDEPRDHGMSVTSKDTTCKKESRGKGPFLIVMLVINWEARVPTAEHAYIRYETD